MHAARAQSASVITVWLSSTERARRASVGDSNVYNALRKKRLLPALQTSMDWGKIDKFGAATSQTEMHATAGQWD